MLHVNIEFLNKSSYMKKIISFFSVLFFGLPLISMAHPGHGSTDGYTIIHYFVEPMHAVVSFGVLFVAVLYIRHLRSQKNESL